MSVVETLTDEERAYLRKAMSHPSVLKALRIIDAHAADRAALVLVTDAVHEELRKAWDSADAGRKRAESEVARLTAERQPQMAGYTWCKLERAEAAEARVLALTEALAEERSECNHRRVRAEAAEARVRELEAQCKHAGEYLGKANNRAEDAEAQAQRDFQLAADWKARYEAAEADATVAKDRLAALQGKVERARGALVDAMSSDAEAIALAREALRG